MNRNTADTASIASMVAQAADDYLVELGRGETPDLSEYALRYPQVASVLPQVLPVLRMIQSLAPAGDLSEAIDASGATLGEFQLVRELGRGGMGVVYEAIQVSLGRRVALKVLPLAAGADTKQLARFQIEAHVAASLHHPHIVPIFAVGCDRGVHYYAMQLVEGLSLAAVLSQRQSEAESARATAAHAGLKGQFAPQVAARLAIQAAEALDHAHSLGVLHRDIKPANLLLEGDSHLWVTDFGLARFRGSGDLTGSGELPGTVRYMSPEQAGGQRTLDARTDIYALGTTLYEMLTGRPAFDSRQRHDLIRHITHNEPIPPRKLNRMIPRDLETIVAKAMAKEPDGRYATASELALDLRRFCENHPILARRPTIPGRITAWSRRHRRATATAVTTMVLIALVSAVGMGVLWKEQRKTNAALVSLQSARDSERQALLFAFKASDQVAGRALQRMLATAKNSPEAQSDREFCRLALAYYEKIARVDAADTAMRTIVAAALHRVGFTRMLLTQGDAEVPMRRSIDVYLALIENDKTNHELRQDLAVAYGDLLLLERASGRKAEAAATLQRLVSLREQLVADCPSKKDYAISLAYHQLELCEQSQISGIPPAVQRDRQGLEESARRAIAGDWADARLLNNMAWMLASPRWSLTSQRTIARDLARRVVSLAPSRGDYWNTLGVAHYRNQEWSEARSALEESMRLRQGGDANDWLFLAMTFYQRGEVGAARLWLDRSLVSINSHASAAETLAEFRDEAVTLIATAPPATAHGPDGNGARSSP